MFCFCFSDYPRMRRVIEVPGNRVSIKGAHCNQHPVCIGMCVGVYSSLPFFFFFAIFILQNLCCHLTFPRKEGAEEDRLVIYNSSEFKLAEEGGMACRELQEVSQV